jgi:hypothetical protein
LVLAAPSLKKKWSEKTLFKPLERMVYRKRGESQVLGIIFGFKIYFNFWINIEIGVRYEIKNELHQN